MERANIDLVLQLKSEDEHLRKINQRPLSSMDLWSAFSFMSPLEETSRYSPFNKLLLLLNGWLDLWGSGRNVLSGLCGLEMSVILRIVATTSNPCFFRNSCFDTVKIWA